MPSTHCLFGTFPVTCRTQDQSCLLSAFSPISIFSNNVSNLHFLLFKLVNKRPHTGTCSAPQLISISLQCVEWDINPLMGKLNPPPELRTITAIRWMAVDGYRLLHFGRGRAAAPPSPIIAVQNVTTHRSTASVSNSYYSMWQYNCLCTLKG